MKYSFIVPLYNGEKYVEECLNSILAQSVSDYEIVVVDDGSKDGGGKICDRYAEEHTCIRVLHRENGGVSRARNIGMDEAKGEYFCFVDCDDVISPFFLETADKLEKGTDIAMFGYTRVSADELCKELTGNLFTYYDEGQRVALAGKTVYDDGRRFAAINCSTVWAKLFRADFIREKGVRFSEGIRIGEDKVFNFSALSSCGSVAFSDSVMYYCRTHGGSVMASRSENYFATTLRTFSEMDRIISAVSDAEIKKEYYELYAMRMVLIVKNALILEFCHKKNTKTFAERKRDYLSATKTGLGSELLGKCNVSRLKSYDRYLYSVYGMNFFFIDFLMKCRPARLIAYGVYRIFRG